MDETIVRDFLAGFDDSRYPEDFLKDYEAIECLAHSDAGETLLVKSRQTGKYDIAKCYTDKTLLSNTNEGKILKDLRHPGLPMFIGEYQNDGMLCVVREYVNGTPLDKYADQNGITPQQAVSFTVQLCDILTCLHGQKPPVIHRDIKPQNIIIDKKDKVHLIDFGISRVYDKDAQEDTVCFGTKHFAAPEQYGFAQTDCRADIFSLGVLLGWLLTGEADIPAIIPKIKSPYIRRIVRKCTAFAPAERYASAARVKRALLRADGSRQKRVLRLACSLLACAACLCAGIVIGRLTAFTPVLSASTGVIFEEPLIEQAVRLALHKAEDEPIQEKDLLSVTELFIYGDQTVKNSESFDALGEHMALSDGVLKNGGIHSLGDLSKLKNLRILRIALEDISDLSPLGNLTALEIVDMRHNPVEDASPLAASEALKGLCLFDTRVSDLSALAACPFLENIDVGKTYITSMTAFSGIERLENLSMMDTPLVTLSGVEEFDALEQIGLSRLADGDLKPLLSLPQLREARLGEDLRNDAEESLGQATFTITYS